jgi:predicted Fe-S protein YdhL (DUF1289 family)
MFAAEPDVMAIETPCIQVCILEPATRLCRGCGRTLDEIARWSALSDAERRRVMAELPERRARLAATEAAAAPARG